MIKPDLWLVEVEVNYVRRAVVPRGFNAAASTKGSFKKAAMQQMAVDERPQWAEIAEMRTGWQTTRDERPERFSLTERKRGLRNGISNPCA